MTGCQTCGGFGMHHDPTVHGAERQYAEGGYVPEGAMPELTKCANVLPQRACRPDWEFHPQTDDGHAHDWHMVVIQPWGPHNPQHREAMTVCRVCTAPRCGSTFTDDPCIERRHHSGLHIYESGRFAAQSGMSVPPEGAG